MTNEQWLDIFKQIGKKMCDGITATLRKEGGTIPLGKGAGGDKTFPVDKWAEDIVIAALEKAHQEGETFTLISEELGVRKFGEGKKIVLVDPIDGSNNAKSGIPFFSTSLALLNSDTLDTLAVGYVINLAAGDEFWALRGSGAYKNGMAHHRRRRPRVSRSWHTRHRPRKSDLPRLLPLLGAGEADSLLRLHGTRPRVPCFGSDERVRDRHGVPCLRLRGRHADPHGGGRCDHRSLGGALDRVVVGLERTAPLLASKNKATHALALNTLTAQGGIINSLSIDM